MLSDRCLSVCLSVTLVSCGQILEWIKMPLVSEVCLGPGDNVLDGDRAPHLSKGDSSPLLPRVGPGHLLFPLPLVHSLPHLLLFLWPPYVIGKAIYIFILWFLSISLSFFFPRRISAAAGWISTMRILYFWPPCVADADSASVTQGSHNEPLDSFPILRGC